MATTNFASFLDLANHHQDADQSTIKTLCQNVLHYGFNAAFVNSCWVKFAKTYFNSQTKHLPGGVAPAAHLGGEIRHPRVGTVISFPLGQDTTEIKIYAAHEAIKKGADELDISTNVGFLKSSPDIYLKELKRLVQAARDISSSVIVKFIIETGLLTDEEIKKAAILVLKSGADFVKTCSGLGPRGSTLKDVKLIKSAIQDKIKIKVAGGISTFEQVQDFLKAGASRIGTSKAVEIIKQK